MQPVDRATRRPPATRRACTAAASAAPSRMRSTLRRCASCTATARAAGSRAAPHTRRTCSIRSRRSAGCAARNSSSSTRCRSAQRFGVAFCRRCGSGVPRPSAGVRRGRRARGLARRRSGHAARGAHLRRLPRELGRDRRTTASRASPSCRRAASGGPLDATARSPHAARAVAVPAARSLVALAGWGVGAAAAVAVARACTRHRDPAVRVVTCAASTAGAAATAHDHVLALFGEGPLVPRSARRRVRGGAERRHPRRAADRPHRALARSPARTHAHRRLATDPALPLGRVRRPLARRAHVVPRADAGRAGPRGAIRPPARQRRARLGLSAHAGATARSRCARGGIEERAIPAWQRALLASWRARAALRGATHARRHTGAGRSARSSARTKRSTKWTGCSPTVGAT